MGSILDARSSAAKLLLIGKSGAGKTGALASLVAAGYNLRMIDTDNGVRPLASLVTDRRYPYAKVIEANGINLATAVRYQTIDTNMKLRNITRKLPGEGNKSTSELLLAPTDAKAWPKVLTLLDHWKEDDGTDLGPVASWSTRDVLVIDSFSTLAKAVYYFSQSMNGRLGARDSGFDYQRDVGEAQSQLTRFLELLYASSVPCNVIVISHITWVDESAGIAGRPREGVDGAVSMPDGYPSAIGRALSPHMGKYFNDQFVMKATGSGQGVRRIISTVPTDGVTAKTSVFLDREYNVSDGMARIFAEITGHKLSPEFLGAFTAAPRAAAPSPGGVPLRAPNSAVA